MKVQISLILGILITFIVLLVPQSVFGAYYSFENLILEKQFPLWKNYDGNNLIINQVVNKTTYNTWESITITPELINNGTNSITMDHYPGWIFTEVKYPSGVVWPQGLGAIPLIPPPLSDTLQPGEHRIEKISYPSDSLEFGGTGKYIITSFALFLNPKNSTEMLLRSDPLQITVIPEFGSISMMVIAISIIGIVMISRIFRSDLFQNNSSK